MRKQIKVNGVWAEGVPSIDEWYRQEVATNVWQEQRNIAVIEDPAPISIDIASVSGSVMHNSTFTKATVYEETNITISGTLLIPDQTFSLPILRNDGRLFIFLAEVVGGAFSVVVNFPTCGSFSYSDDEANIDLPYQVFTVNTFKFDVLRRIVV